MSIGINSMPYNPFNKLLQVPYAKDEIQAIIEKYPLIYLGDGYPGLGTRAKEEIDVTQSMLEEFNKVFRKILNALKEDLKGCLYETTYLEHYQHAITPCEGHGISGKFNWERSYIGSTMKTIDALCSLHEHVLWWHNIKKGLTDSEKQKELKKMEDVFYEKYIPKIVQNNFTYADVDSQIFFLASTKIDSSKFYDTKTNTFYSRFPDGQIAVTPRIIPGSLTLAYMINKYECTVREKVLAAKKKEPELTFKNEIISLLPRSS
jgi:hypothetical protein